jgi:hypothetical protein
LPGQLERWLTKDGQVRYWGELRLSFTEP